MMTSGSVNVDRIRQRAYELWDQDGRPHGQDMEYWLRAEAELAGENGAGAGAPPTGGAGAESGAGQSEPEIVPMDEAASARAPRARAQGKTTGKASTKPADVGEERSDYVQQRRTRKKAEG